MIDEWVDVVDAQGERTGSRVTKREAHARGLRHASVHTWIVTPRGELLVQRRALTKENHPGLWDISSAGHVSAGESPVDAAVREMAEELGVQVDAGELQRLGRTEERWVLNGGMYIDDEIHEIFVIERDVDPSALTLQPSEVDAVRLITVEELEASIGDPAFVDHREEYRRIADWVRRRTS